MGVVEKNEANRLRLKAALPARRGDSIAVNGVCLTVVSAKGITKHRSLEFDLSAETLQRSDLGGLKPGDKVNLEPALRMGDTLGGHIVQGHVDGIGQLVSKIPQDNSVLYEFSYPPELGRYMVNKGSISVDGISLTIVERKDGTFTVAIIPFTEENTVLGFKKIGDPVNLESDVLAKHVERLIEGWREDAEQSALKNAALFPREGDAAP